MQNLHAPAQRGTRFAPTTTLLAVAIGATLAGCGGSDDDGRFTTPLVVANPASACAALTGQAVDAGKIGEPTTGATVKSATLKPAVADAPNAGGTATVLGTPEYCEVLVEIKPVDPTAPLINTQLNLPTSWNGKKLQFGGSGYNGALVTGLDPSRVLMVGDSLHDLEAGRAAGMRSIAVLTGIARAETLAPHADAVLPDIGALPGWIDAQAG